MMGFKNRLTTIIGATFAAASLFAVTSAAQANLSLRVIDGVTTIATITDGGAGDLNPLSGAVTFIGSFGAAITNIDSGLSKPIIGSITAPELHLDGLLASSGAISLTLMLSDTEFSGSLGDFFASIGGVLGGGLGSNITYSVYRDLTNTLFGTGAGTLVCSVGPLTASPFGGNCANTLGLDSNYSITLVAALNHAGEGHSSFNAVAKDDVPVPEPSAMILISIGMIGVAAWSKRKTMAEVKAVSKIR
jgi:hypothetical protein